MRSVWSRRSGRIRPIVPTFPRRGSIREGCTGTRRFIVSRWCSAMTADRDDMQDVPTVTLSAERCHLGDGPTYDAATDTAWWFDILERRLFEAHLASGNV